MSLALAPPSRGEGFRVLRVLEAVVTIYVPGDGAFLISLAFGTTRSLCAIKHR